MNTTLLKKLSSVALMAVLVIGVSACAKKKDTIDSNVDFGSSTLQVGDPNATADGYNTGDNGLNSGALPGSAEDFATNVGDRVFFGYDRYDLTPEARTQLDLQSRWLQQYPDVSVTLEGHADERGTREYNIALSERRANATRDYLVSTGVSPSRVSTLAYGKERPAVTGEDPSAWAQNRRAVSRIN